MTCKECYTVKYLRQLCAQYFKRIQELEQKLKEKEKAGELPPAE